MSTGCKDGGVYFLYGPVSGEIDMGSADALFTASGRLGANDGADSGTDMNQDGFPDILLGEASGSKHGGGSTYLVHGGGW